MEIVVRGRNVEVPEHFRTHVEDKVGQLERFDSKVIRIDVELLHEKNPRQAANCQRVEITLRGKGPVARAEASAPDFYAALELAAGKLEFTMLLEALLNHSNPPKKKSRFLRTGVPKVAPIRCSDSGVLLAANSGTASRLSSRKKP